MMKSRNLLAFALGTALAFSGIIFANASTSTDESWSIPNDVRDGSTGVLFQDNSIGNFPSFLFDNSKSQEVGVNPTCTGTQDPSCPLSSYHYSAVIPVCTNAISIDCISEFGAVDSLGNRIGGNFNRYFPPKAENEYVGNPTWGLPSGTSGSLFTIPGVTHSGGDQFYVNVTLSGNGTSSSGSGDSTLSGFSAFISPVQLQPLVVCGNANCPNAGYANVDPNSGGKYGLQGPGYDGVHNCRAVSTHESLCAQRFGFPKDFSYYLTVKLSRSPSGWLHGRMSDPNIVISKDGGIITLGLQGTPITVPIVYAAYLYADMPQALKDVYDVTTGSFKGGSGGGMSRHCCTNPSDPKIRNITSTPSSSGASGISELKAWLPYVDDKATAAMSTWSVRTLTSQEQNGSNSCFKSASSVTGIVTTNSTEYSAGPPAFEDSSGTLTYQVAAPHFMPSGDVFKGNYDLVMRSDVARCVYGFSKAPVSASISVSSADGSNEVATTMLGENNGWLHLRASNFEFSSPTINVKLTQEAPAPVATPPSVETPQASSSPVPAAKLPSPQAKKTNPKMIKIACIKGSVTRFVVATKPICPLGYKKK